MAIIFINAPAIKRLLVLETWRYGVEPADYVGQTLTKYLGDVSGDTDQTSLPFYATWTPKEWSQDFNG